MKKVTKNDRKGRAGRVEKDRVGKDKVGNEGDPTDADIEGSVMIFYLGGTSAILFPDLGILDRNIQTMQWSLMRWPIGSGSVEFAPNGIEFVTNPAGKDNWPGETPVRINNWQYKADVRRQIKPGGTKEIYEYDINVDPKDETGPRKITSWFSIHERATIDPDMENRPQP